MTFNTIRFEEIDHGFARITLNRPEKHNAMSGKMIDELAEIAAALCERQDLRAVILTGEGKSFCAGGDLDWMKSQFSADRHQRIMEATKLAKMLKAVNEIPQPLIGMVNGNAFGGGIGMMCVCDLVIASSTARFGLTETRLGLIPATISPYVIARMGEGRARRLFMSAKVFGPSEAESLGLVSRTVDVDGLEDAVMEEAMHYLMTAPEAVAAAKRLARSLGPVIDEKVIEDTANRLADTWETRSAREGVNAFLEKRKADWMS